MKIWVPQSLLIKPMYAYGNENLKSGLGFLLCFIPQLLEKSYNNHMQRIITEKNHIIFIRKGCIPNCVSSPREFRVWFLDVSESYQTQNSPRELGFQFLSNTQILILIN